MKPRYLWDVKGKGESGKVTDGLINVLIEVEFKKGWFQWGKNKRLYKTEYFEIIKDKKENPEIIKEDLEIKICDSTGFIKRWHTLRNGEALVELHVSEDYNICPLVTYISNYFTLKKIEFKKHEIKYKEHEIQ